MIALTEVEETSTVVKLCLFTRLNCLPLKVGRTKDNHKNKNYYFGNCMISSMLRFEKYVLWMTE